MKINYKFCYNRNGLNNFLILFFSEINMYIINIVICMNAYM